MRHSLLAALLVTTGCGALRDRAVDYAQEVAISQVELVLDRQLDKRGLSLAQLKQLADDDKSGAVTAGEVAKLAKDSLADFVTIKAKAASDEGKAELEGKLKALASASDLQELRAAAEEQEVFGKGTLGALVAMLTGYLAKQVFSAKADGKRDARLDTMEKLTGLDLNKDGRIGSSAAAAAQPSA